ncbi:MULTISPECIES: AI-2E family transporter [unclassified Actinomyces]|uniref:AI-2E family transporter n=1 Tax=unclassified Actinomyces TaxID=2609248 RepID=UPI002017B27E|nr:MULTISPECIES: AI-2E family transporter [unclassified Actinomyces]MCL3777330.1 AI-2E family transporter [Actinomyces sp. AC-20-1]MCL3789646.1 AI-2E family transporter [Actinomyces sp. 187325]MCL3792189.1 AI-2E family transporter [Actinomyces sp. 186855]MCL3794821.1 AI-2E family transporter [Actinomyces sp. 217892]
MSDHQHAVAGRRTQGEATVLTIAALVVGCVGIYFTRSLIGPAFFALTLVLTVRPLVSWASRHHVPRPVSALAAVLIIYTFVIGLFVALGMAIAQLIETLPQYSAKLQQIWEQIQALLVSLGIEQDMLLDQLSSMISTSRVVDLAQGLMGQLTSFGSILMVMAMTVVFLMFDMSRIEVRATALAELKPGIASGLAGFAQSVRSYWLVSTVFGLIVAVLDVVALGFLGVPMAMTWGVLAFITNYIPNIGFVIGVIPPALLALVDSGPWTALWVVVAYVVLNFVIQSLIQPKFTGDAVGLNTTTTFLSLMFWSSVIGALGTILAVPLTLFAKAVLIDSDPRSAWVGIFLSAGDEPVDRPEAVGPRTVAALDPDGDGADEAVGAVSDELREAIGDRRDGSDGLGPVSREAAAGSGAGSCGGDRTGSAGAPADASDGASDGGPGGRGAR